MTKINVPNLDGLKTSIFVVNHISNSQDALIWAAFNASLMGAAIANDAALQTSNADLVRRLMDDMRKHDEEHPGQNYWFPEWFTLAVTATVLKGQQELRALDLES